MPKVEMIGTSEVAKLLSISEPSVYSWHSQDRARRRPFFPQPNKVKRNKRGGGRQYAYEWKKKDILKFINTLAEKPWYAFTEMKYEKYKAENASKPKALSISKFDEFHRLMYELKQKREANNA